MILIPGFFFVCCLPSSAQEEQLHFEHYDYQHGLSNTQISHIYQDHVGFLWIGTIHGLNRFDGISFKYWVHSNADTNSLVKNDVLRIAEDRQNNLWVGTQEGVSCFDPYTEQFTNYHSEGRGIFHFTRKNCKTFVDAADNVWIGHDEGIAVLNAARNKITDITIELQPPGRNNFISSFLEDKIYVWAATGHGLYRINKKDFSTRRFSFTSNSNDPEDGLSDIKWDSKGRIWCGTWGYGIGLFSPGDSLIRNLGTIPGIVYPTEENGETVLYIAYRGLVRMKAEEFIKSPESFFKNHRYVHSDKDPQSLADNNLTGLFIDRTGTLWGNNWKGIEKCDLNGRGFKAFSYEHLVDTKFSPNSICQGTGKNKFWILTGKNIFLFDRQKGTFQKNDFDIAQYRPMNMIKTRAGYWITTLTGLLYMDSSMKLKSVYNKRTAKGLTADLFNRLVEGKDGLLYITCYRNGVAVFDPVKKDFREYFGNELDRLRQEKKEAEDIFMDDSGCIWLAMQGVYRYNPGNGRLDSFVFCGKESIVSECNSATSFYYTRDSKLYIGTRSGLHYYDFADGLMHKVIFPSSADRFNLSIFSVFEDASKRLWMGTHNGLLMYDKVNQYVRLFTQKDGLPDNNILFGFMQNKSELFAGMDNQIVAFNPLDMKKMSTTPVPVLASVSVNNEKTDFRKQSLVINYDQTVSLEFVSLNYISPAQNQYKYQLNEDGALINLGTSHSLRFSNLAGGDYVLKVVAAGIDGTWNNEPLIFYFTVMPPYWRTWWFSGIVAVFGAGIGYAVYRNRINQLMRMERLRTRIAADLHDDVGATLSSISMYSNTVKNQVKEKMPHLEAILDKMGENSRTMVSNMSDIIWALNPDNDEGEKLAERIEMYAKEACSAQEVYLIFSRGDTINNLSLTPEQRKNIYLVFKEALNNALKYAQATEIRITIDVIDKKLAMSLADNGVGFIPEKESGTGNGLKNMYRRANEIGGHVVISSTPGEGTTITLSCIIT